ncbi:MAG TPA: MFS transporter [Nitrososphaerales archaeon]|nr:MFS transporter [Nitrososphaerales archaeon]
MQANVSQKSRATAVLHFVKLFAGVGAVGFLTHVAEYSSFIIVLVFLSDKLTVTFRLGTIGYVFVGSISGIYLVTSGLISVPMGHLCDKYGRQRFTIFGGVLGAISLGSLIVANQFTDLTEFLVAMTISLCALGIAHGTYTSSTLSYSGDLAEKYQEMGKAYGLVDGAEFAGFAFGPAFGTAVAVLTGSRIAVFQDALFLMLASAVIAVFLMPEIKGASYRTTAGHGAASPVSVESHPLGLDALHEEEHAHSASWGDYINAFRTPIVSVALLTTIDGAIGFAGFFQFVPIYANTLRGAIPIFGQIYGYFPSIMAITVVCFMIPLGHVMDQGKRRMPILVAGLIGSSISIAAVFFNSTLPTFLAASFAHGIFIAMIRISQLLILGEASHPSNRAAIMGTNHAMEHAGYGIAAVSIGFLVGFFGFIVAFRALSIILFLAGLAFLVYAVKKKLR